jgi:hypothetical protein
VTSGAQYHTWGRAVVLEDRCPKTPNLLIVYITTALTGCIPVYTMGSYSMERLVVNTNDKEIGMVPLRGCRCRCGHEWLPRMNEEKPRVCPKCKSANWDRPLQRKANKRTTT